MSVSYVVFLFVFTLALYVLFSYRKKLSYLLHAIIPYLYGKLINEQVHFIWVFVVRFYPKYGIYCYSLWIRLFQLFVFVNYILCFFLCNFAWHGICIEHIYYLVNLYFFLACTGHPKSVVTWHLGPLLDFWNY